MRRPKIREHQTTKYMPRSEPRSATVSHAVPEPVALEDGQRRGERKASEAAQRIVDGEGAREAPDDQLRQAAAVEPAAWRARIEARIAKDQRLGLRSAARSNPTTSAGSC